MEMISVIGAGFVGKAVYSAFSTCCKVLIYDKFIPNFNSIEEAVESKFIFVCVPTPTNFDNGGEQDLSAIYDVMDYINRLTSKTKIIIIKSTIVPGTTRKLSLKYPEHDFVFNPEFLTERNYVFDFFNQTRIVLGGKTKSSLVLNEVEKLYKIRFPHTPIQKCSFEEAEIVKYLLNCYFASKVSFMNEVYEICEKMGIQYNSLKNLFLGDQRVSNSHTDVPGHDNRRGFGGKCFPKDLKAFIDWGCKLGLDMTMFKASEEVNMRVRNVNDWEHIKGATTKNNYS